MDKRQLGRTGLTVSRLGLGGLLANSRLVPYETSRATVQRAYEVGIGYVDTAPAYGDSEQTLGRVFAEVGQPAVVSTKLGGHPQPFAPKDADVLRRSVKNSLRLLGRDQLDMLLVHEPDRPQLYDWWDDFDTATGPVLELLGELKAQGVVRCIGLGGTTAYELARLARTGKFDVVLTAFNYSVLWREAEWELLPAARAHGMGVILGSPLQQGALARRYDAELDSSPWLSTPRRQQLRALYALLDDAGLDIADAALRFVATNPDIHCILTGARSPAELAASVASLERGALPDSVTARLDEIAAQVPFRPFEEPSGMPFGRPHPGPPRVYY